jgi:hypothetical protein
VVIPAALWTGTHIHFASGEKWSDLHWF